MQPVKTQRHGFEKENNGDFCRQNSGDCDRRPQFGLYGLCHYRLFRPYELEDRRRRATPVAHVGQRTADDDAHRVGEIAVLEFLFNVELLKSFAVSERSQRIPPSHEPIHVVTNGLILAARPVFRNVSGPKAIPLSS